MIQNERQYRITKKQVGRLEGALESLRADSEEQATWITKAQAEALESQISELRGQLREYQMAKSGEIRFSEQSDLSDLHRVLVQARIAKGLSQKDLAQSVGVSQQQIQRYESSEYMGASLSRLVDIAGILGISIRESWGGDKSESYDSIYTWRDEESINWKEFPIKEMIKRNWFEPKHGEPVESLVKNYFLKSAGSHYVSALHRKKYHGGNTPNEYALLAWQARVLDMARRSAEKNQINDFLLDDTWVKDLAELSSNNNSPLLAMEFLREKGIILIAERHLPGTYLDGAAMLLDDGVPVIGLTLRHDRLDNFWFVLMHEIGHIFLHLFDSLGLDFFDEGDEAGGDELEREADKFALDMLIPEREWASCLSRFSMTEESVIQDAARVGVGKEVVAGRIRKESGNYQVLNSLVGQGQVRNLFWG